MSVLVIGCLIFGSGALFGGFASGLLFQWYLREIRKISIEPEAGEATAYYPLA